MTSSADIICTDHELINKWLLQCVKGDTPETNERIDITWCLEHGAEVNTKNSDCNTPLHEAVDRQDKTIVNLLLKHGADVNARGKWEYTPLHLAVLHRDVSLVDLLLNCGADVNTDISDSETPLHVAVRCKDSVIVDRLLKHGADVNMKNTNGETPLHVVVDNGEPDLMEQLLQYGADVSIINKHKETPLHLAVQRGEAPLVDLLLKYGADLKSTNAPGDTLLHLAARSKKTSSVELLLKYGADISIRNKRGEMPIHDAARSGDVSVVDLLLKHGADVKTPNKSGCTSLHISVVYGKAPLIELMLSTGININTTDGTGDTPLHLAVSCNKTDTVEQLLKYSPDVSIRNNQGDTPLLEAVRSADTSIVEHLLKYGASMDIKDSENDTPLHLAVRRGNATIVDLLLKYGTDVKTTNKIGYTPLHLAAIYGKAPILELMLSSGVDVNTIDKAGDTPMHLAVSSNKTPAVDLLLKYGANVCITNNRDETPLYRAVRLGRVTLVDQLLKHGSGVNVKNCDGDTPLHLAAALGDANVMEQLLKNGADVKMVNNAGNTPLHLAACSKEINTVDLLLKYGAEMNIMNENGDMPIHNSARNGDVLIMDMMLKHGANVNTKDSEDETPLHLAVYNEDASIIDLLLKCGANANITNKSGHTPLHKAVVHGKVPVIELLLNSGVEVNTMDKDGNTSLHLAISFNHPLTVDLLLKNGADISIINSSGETPLYNAMRVGAANIVEQLLKYGAKIDTVDKNGNTPLHFAVYHGDAVLVDLLLKYGTDTKATNKDGETPIHLALRHENKSILDLLVKYGAGVNSKNSHDDMPLYMATDHNHATVVNLLLKCGTNVDIINKFSNKSLQKNTVNGDLPLANWGLINVENKVDKMMIHKPAAISDASILNLLLHSGVNVNAKDVEGNTPLHLAARYKETSTVNLLLELGGDVSITNKHGETPLFLAVHHGNKSLVDLLLKTGADVNITTRIGDTSLHEAVDSGDAVLVSQLLQYKANPNIANSTGDTPLHLASRDGNMSIVDILLKYGADVATTNYSGFTPLHTAAANGKGSIADMLLSSGAAMNMTDEAGNTPLHLAASQNDTHTVELLLKYGVDLNISNEAGDTPLHLATYCNETPIVKLLLKYGSDFNITNKRGESPLYWAVCRGDVTLVEQLLKYGANVDKKDSSGDTSLHLAVHRGDAAIVDLLLQFSADVNATNKAGNTPLHIAARRKHSHIAHLLLRRGADVTLRNLGLDTPLTVARVFNFDGYEDIVGILETAETLIRDNYSQNKKQLQTFFSSPASPNSDKLQNNELPGFKYLKKHGNSGVCGQLYETKLLSLVLIRALNEDQIEHFLLGTNVRGIGDMDDICIRYQVRDQNRPVVLFVQAKHREDPDKAKLTVEDVRSASGDFSLRKYFESYLKIKDRFQTDNEDPMFDGDFGDVECNLIIYTPVKDSFTKKITGRQPSQKVHYLINTGQNIDVFQYNHDEDDINYLTEITAIERLKTFGTVFLEMIMPEKDKFDMILMNKLITRHHVAMGREVLQQCSFQQENKEYRNWKFRQDFFENDCKYLKALENTLIKEFSTKRYDKSKVNNEDRINFEHVVRDPCASTISKIIGKLAIYHGKSKKLQLLEVSDFEKLIGKDKYISLQESFNKTIIDQSVINEAVRIKLKSLEIRLPVAFGNIDMTFRGSEAKVRRRMKAVSDKLISLFEFFKDTKIVTITDDIVGPGKIIERGIIDINGGIGSAIGNLLILDSDTQMLKFNMDSKILPKNAALFLEELKDDKYMPVNKQLCQYRIQIDIEGFPKVSFKGDEYDKKQARDFLGKLWFYTNQAKENEVERILKNHINMYYNYEKETNNLLFEIHSNAIFLRSHDEIQKWWMQKGETCYLSQESDIFGRAKLACINNLFQTLVDYMQYFNISCMDFKFNQRIHQQETSTEVPQALNMTLGKLFEIFDTQNKSIDISIENKKDIANLLQTAERLARDIIPPSRDRSKTPCSTPTEEQTLVLHNNSQSNFQSKFKYFKRSGSSGVSGQLYETKLLCLVLIRALNDEEIDPFVLGTNIRGIGDMDDICLRYCVRNQGKPVVLFVQAKHRENSEKGKLTVEDILNVSGDFSLRKYFEAYIKIKGRFQADNEDPMFEGDFDDVECNLIIYTPVKDCFTKKMIGKQPSEKIHYLINTGQSTEVFQYHHDEADIEYLTEIVALEQIQIFGTVFLELIMSEKDKLDMMLNKLIARYHVVMRRNVLIQCKTQPENKKYRLWKFRSDFFENECKYVQTLKNTFIKELTTKRCDTSKLTDEDRKNLEQFIRRPCASTISTIIGKLVAYNGKSRRLQFLEMLEFEELFEKDEFESLLEELDKIVIYESVINEAARIKISCLEMKLPVAFGNLDLTFDESETNAQTMVKKVSDKLASLFEINKETKIVEIAENTDRVEKKLGQVIDINDSIGSAIGNLLVLDTETKMFKFELDSNVLEKNAALVLKQLKSDRYKPFNEELRKYRIKINIERFPKWSFEGDEYDKKQARDFLTKLWFYTEQAKENEVELILKDEIRKYYKREICENRHEFRSISDPVFFISHDEIQKWWMQIDGSPYLSRASELFERAELADIDNLLLTVINFMYISRIHSIDINIKQRVNDYTKFVQMHKTFNKMAGRLFNIFDSEFNESTNIKLPSELLNINGNYDFGCDLVFSLEIHPDMEWVALKLLAHVWVVFHRVSYSLIAKAGPGHGYRRPKDGFLLQSRFRDRQHYFIEGGKDPLDLMSPF